MSEICRAGADCWQPLDERPDCQPGRILDLFAGAGGWEEGLGVLGMRALGIEADPWACETKRAAGHERLQADVTALDPHDFAPVWGLIASPPCQAYSMAGKGLGRVDGPLVVACAHELAAGSDTRAARLRECRDPRSLLTVEPLRFAFELRPRWIALEQVPAALGLWSLFAELLGASGYETVAGILSAERYGVPQTRKRAFLIASLDGPVALPAPTHRSYDPHRKETPQDEVRLKPWVSMAEALGWLAAERAGSLRRNDRPSNRPANRESGTYCRRDERAACRYATTLTARTRPRARERAECWAWRNGRQPNSTMRFEQEPGPTVYFGHAASDVVWVPCAYDTRQSGARSRPVSEPAPTMLAVGLAKGVPVWAGRRPATTVSCDRRVHPPGHKQNASDPPGRYQQRRGVNAVRVTVEQAATLQGFLPGYPWKGARTRQFEQVGNAVPPPVAHRVLEQAIAPSLGKGRIRP